VGDSVRIAVAIHDLPVWSIPPLEVARIARALPDDVVVDAREPAERRTAFAGADVLFATKISAEEFAIARQVRWMHSSAVGVGGLLPPAVVAGDVVVTNARGVHSDAIAEHAIALVLALRRGLHTAAARQAAREWAQAEMAVPVTPHLSRTRVLVVGLGSIGARVAALASGLGMMVTGVRRRVSEPAPPGVGDVIGPDRLGDRLGDADVVVLAVPRTEQTRALIGRAEFGAMKRSALLVNVARGRLVDEAALVDALDTGRIAGAGLDAFQQEPLPPDHPLWRAPNTIITPHTASFSGDYWTPVVDLFLENVARFKRGAPLLNVVDKRLGY
jgi:phosphoglycerate dehydrogenase-like enzyme